MRIRRWDPRPITGGVKMVETPDGEWMDAEEVEKEIARLETMIPDGYDLAVVLGMVGRVRMYDDEKEIYERVLGWLNGVRV